MGKRTGPGSIDTPFQFTERHPYGFFEIIRILSLDNGLQYLAYVETVFRQLHGVLVIDHLVLVGS